MKTTAAFIINAIVCSTSIATEPAQHHRGLSISPTMYDITTKTEPLTQHERTQMRRWRRTVSVGDKCVTDRQCAIGQYCNGGFCARDGTCDTDMDCLLPKNRLSKDIRTLPGFIKCQKRPGMAGKCVKDITTTGNDCPPDQQPLVQCAFSPCSATRCSEGAVTCVDSACGSCLPIFFNSTGDQVCIQDRSGDGSGTTPLSTDPTRSIQPYDGPTQWVPDDQPTNDQTTNDQTTNDQTTNDQTTNDLITDNQDSVVQLGSPTDTNDDTTDSTTYDVSRGTPCASDSVCGSSMYCAAGTCMRYGTCNSNVDCKNPSNDLTRILSGTTRSGVITCEANRCVSDESGDICPAGSDSIFCVASPCEFSKCAESVQCVDSACGGCQAIHFDAAGN